MLEGSGEGFTLYFCGESSTGKSSLIEMIGGMYSKDDNHIISTSETTPRGLEERLFQLNDSTLCLDELGKFTQSKGENYAINFALKVTGGMGKTKSQAAAVQSKFPDLKWRTVVVAAGEDDLREAIRDKEQTGASARFLQIPVSPRSEGGIFNKLDYDNAVKLLGKLENAIAEHDGYAWDKFLRILTKQNQKCREILDKSASEFLNVVVTSNSYEKRKAEKFALIAAAGELLIRMKLIDLDKGRMLEAVSKVYNQHLSQSVEAGPKIQLAVLAARAALATFLQSPYIVDEEKTLKEQNFWGSDDIIGFWKNRFGPDVLFLKPLAITEIFDVSNRKVLLHDFIAIPGLLYQNKKRGSPYQQVQFTDIVGMHKRQKLLKINKQKLIELAAIKLS